jgi:hypothetical protein
MSGLPKTIVLLCIVCTLIGCMHLPLGRPPFPPRKPQHTARADAQIAWWSGHPEGFTGRGTPFIVISVYFSFTDQTGAEHFTDLWLDRPAAWDIPPDRTVWVFYDPANPEDCTLQWPP